MAELNRVEFKYALNGIEQSQYHTVLNTGTGHYIIDASNMSLITHKKKFDFMRLSDLYTTTDAYTQNNYALSIKGAKDLYDYISAARFDDSTNLLQKITDTSRYINERLNLLISGNAQTAVNRAIDTFNEIEAFLTNISDQTTLTSIIANLENSFRTEIGKTNNNVTGLQSDLNDYKLANLVADNSINTNIFNISTNINSSINRTITDISTNLNDLIDRVTTIELGGGSGGSGIDIEVLRNYVLFKDLTDTNLITSFIDPQTSEKYNLSEILSAFAEPYIPDTTIAEILYDNPAIINTMDTNNVLGTIFNKPTIALSGSIKLNALSDIIPIIEAGTITGTITYRKLKANRVETENREYTVSKDFDLTTNNGAASFSTTLTFDSMPTLYFGENNDDNTVVSLAISIKKLKATYSAKNLNITNGIIKGNNNQNIIISLPSVENIIIPETTLYLGTNAENPIITYTSFTPAYYILKTEKITAFTTRTGTIFNPMEEIEIQQDGEYYYYVLIPNNYTYENLKIYYKGTDTGIISTYSLIATEFKLYPTFSPNVTRVYTLYVAVNAQNKPIKLLTAHGGSVKIIL